MDQGKTGTDDVLLFEDHNAQSPSIFSRVQNAMERGVFIGQGSLLDVPSID